MPLSFSSDDGSHPTIVAIDKDKHSASAVKWAVDHLVISNPTLVLVHVRIKNSTNRRYPPSFITFSSPLILSLFFHLIVQLNQELALFQYSLIMVSYTAGFLNFPSW